MKQHRNLREGVNIRLPDGMRDQIRQRAKSNRRSMNAEIVLYLEQILGSEKAKGPVETAISPSQSSTNPHKGTVNEPTLG